MMTPIRDSDSPRPGAVAVLVLWLSCSLVSVVGHLLPYEQPVRVAPREPVIFAQKIEVELISDTTTEPTVPTSAASQVQSLPISAAPLLAQPTRIEPKELVRLAAPSVLKDGMQKQAPPVESLLPEAGSYAGSMAIVATPSTAMRSDESDGIVKQTLTFGRGEGRQPAPEYPPTALRSRQEGTVAVRLRVGEDGRVLTVEVAEPSPWPLLNESALRTVRRRWRFQPGPVRLFEVPIRFELKK